VEPEDSDAAATDGGSASKPTSRAARRRAKKRGLSDRLRDAIS